MDSNSVQQAFNMVMLERLAEHSCGEQHCGSVKADRSHWMVVGVTWSTAEGPRNVTEHGMVVYMVYVGAFF